MWALNNVTKPVAIASASACVAAALAVGGAGAAFAADGNKDCKLTAAISASGQTITVVYSTVDKPKGCTEPNTPIYLTVNDATKTPQPHLVPPDYTGHRFPETKVLTVTLPGSVFNGCKPLDDTQVDARAGGTSHGTSYLVKARHFTTANGDAIQSPNDCTPTPVELPIPTPDIVPPSCLHPNVDVDFTKVAHPHVTITPEKFSVVPGTHRDFSEVADKGYVFQDGNTVRNDQVVNNFDVASCSSNTPPVTHHHKKTPPVVVVVTNIPVAHTK